MQTSYTITQKGMMYAVASSDKDITGSLLTLVLKQYFDHSVTFVQICGFLDGNKKAAFKIICEMLESDFINIDENFYESDSIRKIVDIHVADMIEGNEFIISDFNGLTVHNCGFGREDALNISSMACDLIKITRRSQVVDSSAHPLYPVSIETTWNYNEISIYLLYPGDYSCLLTCKNDRFFKQPEVISLIAHLSCRYANG